jgi:hypothetical protein
MERRHQAPITNGNGVTSHGIPVGSTTRVSSGWACWFDRTEPGLDGINIVSAAVESRVRRDLDCVEFCGVGSIVTAAHRAGHRAMGFDGDRSPGETNISGKLSENILSPDGFRNALHLVQRVRVGGFV